MQAEKTHSSALAKILNKEKEPRDAMKDARPAIDTPMLDVVFKSGAIVSLPYAYMTRVSYEPGDRLELEFGDTAVVIEGRNLDMVREKVRRHKADEIHEGTEAEDALKPESAAHVERIRIVTEKEKQREANRGDTGRHKGIER